MLPNKRNDIDKGVAISPIILIGDNMFFKQIHYRIKITLLIIILLFLVIIGKVFYIQVFSYKKINKYANNLWSRNLPIASDRGKIYDRNGVVFFIMIS